MSTRGTSSRGATGSRSGTRSSSGRSTAKPSSRSAKPAPKSSARSGTGARKSSGSRGTSQKQAKSGPGAFRQAIDGREQETVGVVLIVLAIVLGLVIYVRPGGLVGSGIDTFVGWIFGLGRFVVPIVMIIGGVSLVRSHRSSSPPRLIVGWTLVGLAVLGVMHVIRNPESWDDRTGMSEGGGFVGAAVARPLESLVGTWGAVAILVAVFIGGVLLITSTSLRTMAEQTGRGVTTVARPIGRAAKKAISDLSTLSSERQGADRASARDERRGAARSAKLDSRRGHTMPPPPPGAVAGRPALYDGADDAVDIFASAPEGKPAKRRHLAPPTAPGQGALPLEARQVGEWTLPPVTALKQVGQQAVNMEEIEQRGITLQESLSQHGVETELIGMTVGPTVTRYELELGAGVKVAKVTSLHRDIAYAMAAVDVRILAPIPGRSAIGVEVPNHQRQLVALGDLMVSEEAAAATHPLQVAVGKDIAGRAVFLDLATTPHLLIAGATGAGKSSGINCIITSLLMRTTPEQVKLILIDPKQVEMGQYQKLPHLLTQPVTNPKKAANALGWAVKEMERRYDVLSEVGFRDIGGYNEAWAKGEIEPPVGVAPEESPYEHMPYIVVVVDELNDLMMVAARDVEESITRIAQKARAVGIHLIIATQRPSVNVITGVIKANVPARMAFAVSSLTDSRVILDQPGAEKLVGKGDMLLLPGNSSVPNRIQGSFVTEEEVRRVVKHWRDQAPEPIYTKNVEDDDDGASPAAGGANRPMQLELDAPFDVTSDANAFSAGDDDEDTLMMRQAMELVVRSQLGSTSMLQRKLKVGFARAGRIMDLLEERGVVGPSEGSKAREVLMSVEEFELLQESNRA